MSQPGELLGTIERILDHEASTGWRDRAVSGGLEAALAHWRRQAGEAAPAVGERVEALCRALEGYGRRPTGQRRRAVARAQEILRRPSGPRASPRPKDPDAPLTALGGISETYARRLGRLGLATLRDLLYLFPRRYRDYSQIKAVAELVPGEEVTVRGRVWETSTRRTRRGLTVTTTILADGSGTVQATWFNQPYLERQLRPGRRVVLSGEVESFRGRLTFSSPEWEPAEGETIHTARLVPIYPLTEGLSQRVLRRLVRRAVAEVLPALQDPLPQELRRRVGLLQLTAAVAQMHFPSDWEALKRARQRLVFEELLYLQLGVLEQRRRWRAQPGVAVPTPPGWLEGFEESLPFQLTGAQRRAAAEVLEDLSRAVPMSRLLQGDVGSGKTVVALAAMLAVVEAGHQAAFMAPTEILAEQHHQTLRSLLGDRPVKLDLLKGSLSPGDRAGVRARLARGRAGMVVGTHALIQEGVQLPRLALAIVDEQHRFGVRQRAALRGQGFNPHLLVMTATPIPRSLAHTLFGDLDLSVIDELPPLRKPVETRFLGPEEREEAYAFVRREVARGNKAFVICPLVEGSEAVEARAATEEYERLQRDVFPDLRLELLHGRMSSAEKEEAMARFARGPGQVLVSTPVVEVGVDVPRATVMLIESAERFGLAQLHQFRGRVGRGEAPSYCLLLSQTESQRARERLSLVASTRDGFALAAHDLADRGPGHLTGTFQSGPLELKVTRLRDLEGRLLRRAREEARRLLRSDPQLARPEHRAMAQALAAFWEGRRFAESTELDLAAG